MQGHLLLLLSKENWNICLFKKEGDPTNMVFVTVGNDKCLYTIKGLKLMVASRELLAEHYADHKDKPFFEGLLEFMSSGPVVAMIVEGQRVVEGMRVLMGSTDPTTAPAGTIRGDLGRAWNSPHMENLIHGSDSVDNAMREISLWFPEIY